MQALKVAQKNEGLLKKKADMLELTVLSHQKSMDKGRANMVLSLNPDPTNVLIIVLPHPLTTSPYPVTPDPDPP